jgi:hypothetical protein
MQQYLGALRTGVIAQKRNFQMASTHPTNELVWVTMSLFSWRMPADEITEPPVCEWMAPLSPTTFGALGVGY